MMRPTIYDEAYIVCVQGLRLKIQRKLLLTTFYKSYTGFRLPPNYMTLNDLCARFKVIDSLNVVKMAKYSLVTTPTPCRVAGCIISVRHT